MDFIEKARIRIKNWLDHNARHREEYELFADQLEKEGKTESALHIRRMALLTADTNEALRLALESLEEEGI